MDRVKHNLLADPPPAARPRGGIRELRYWTALAIRHVWLWRDVTPGPIIATLGWLLLGYGPFAWLTITAIGSLAGIWWDTDHGRTANTDRAAHQFKRRFQKAWLDLRVDAPIPAIGRPQVRTHSVSAHVELVEGTNEWELGRKVRQRLSNIYRSRCDLHPADDGTALLVIRHGDALATEPDPPAHLGNPNGEQLVPTWEAMPLGIDQEADPHMLNMAEHPHMLVLGYTGAGKSSSMVPFALTCVQAPHVAPVWIEPSPKSGQCLRAAMTVISNPAAALALIEDEQKTMEKRHLVMEELGTSLLRPSPRTPGRVIFLDEFQNFLDDELHGKDYAARFRTAVMDILNRGRAVGYYLVAIGTNPRKAILTEGMRDQFTVRLCFKVADSTAATMALGDKIPRGYEPQLLPKRPGIAILKSDGYYRLRCWRLWDAKAAKVASTLAKPSQHPWPPPTPQPNPSQLHQSNEHFSDEVDDLTELRPDRRHGDAYDLVLAEFQRGVPLSAKECAERIDRPLSTVKYHMARLPLQKCPNHRYTLIGAR